MNAADFGRGVEATNLRTQGSMRNTTQGEKRRGGATRRIARYTPGPYGGNARGFTAIELLVLLSALAALTTIYMALQRPSEMIPLERASHQFEANVIRGRAEAEAGGGEALIAILPDGRYSVSTGAAGSLNLTTIPGDAWERLPDGLTWGAGSATTSPLGQPLGPLPAQVYCDADGSCGVPDPAAIYLLRSRREPHRVAAIVLDQSGAVQSWRWESGTAGWKSTAR